MGGVGFWGEGCVGWIADVFIALILSYHFSSSSKGFSS